MRGEMTAHHVSQQTHLPIRAIPAEDHHESDKYRLPHVKLLDALDHDDRPSFAVNVHTESCACDDPLELFYANPALTNARSLYGKVRGQRDAASIFEENSVSQLAFSRWVRHGHVDDHDPQRRRYTYIFEEHTWTAVSIGSVRIISGLPTLLLWVNGAPGRQPRRDSKGDHESLSCDRAPAPSIPPTNTSSQTNTFRAPDSMTCLRSSELNYRPFDYTVGPTSSAAKQNTHIAYFRSVDWSATPLGPMETWSADLRTTISAILNNSFPGVLFWGDELIMIYNEAYTQLLGPLHPCMGKSIRHEAPAHWLSFEPLVKHINETGTSITERDMLLFIDRNGRLEETHWSFQFVPVLDQNGHVAAYFQSLHEITHHRLLERRVTSLVEMGSHSANVRNIEALWETALHSLTLNDKDIPFALLYVAERSSTTGMAISPGSAPPLETCLLKGTIGAKVGHPIAPASINIHQDSYAFRPFMLEALRSRKATVVHIDHLDQSVFEDVDWKGYGDACRTFVICPILPTTGEAEGFLVLGTNPRTQFNEKYQQYFQVMLRLLATSLASILLFEEEVRQREDAIVQAARIQEQLLAELALKEKKFQRFAERSDVAIFITDTMGNYTYRNQCWFDLFNPASPEGSAQAAWSRIAFPEDIPKCEAVFAKLAVDHEAISFELRTTIPWTPPVVSTEKECDDTQHFTWVLCSAYPELTTNGDLEEIVGVVTNISRQKWAEGVQQKGKNSALESKQHLEHFIDTTSHEMRNPLSAILQCADGILTSYNPEDRQPPTPGSWSNFMEQTLDAASTIAQCATHMRNIVNDILTVSKLDSGLLVITPVDTQPIDLVRHAVKMFDAEAKAAGIELRLEIDESYHRLNVDWASLDPTRVLQVLINLLTNAIKFTRLELKKHVSVIMSASEEEPRSTAGGIQFQKDKLVHECSQLEEDWKLSPDLLYLQFSIKDTGRGLSEAERGTLFARFSQASPRTHIHYGGSGLGLFISRRLTELQGGSIGLASKSKEGSTFSFYIKTRRVIASSARKSSVAIIFPEDVRHRQETSLLVGTQDTPLIRISPEIKEQFLSEANVNAAPIKAGTISPPPDQALTRRTSIPSTLHVLVVEDNLVNQRVLAKQLRSMGCVVTVANHGQEALDHLPKTIHWNHEHPYSRRHARDSFFHIPSTEPCPGMDEDSLPKELNLILMDWEMPIMDGLTAVARIRDLEKEGIVNGRIPVIGVTANVRQQQIETAIAAGMDDVVGKPFRVAELLVRMRGLVAGVEAC